MDEGKTQKSELIILLKASIINSKSDWQDNLNPAKQRYEQLEAKPMWK
jgi:MSHA biogenesis protein MshL